MRSVGTPHRVLDMVDLPDFWSAIGIALALIGGAATVISVPGPGHWEFRVARACFMGAAVLFLVKIAVWGMVELSFVRLSVTAIVGAMVAVGLALALRWVQAKQDRHPIGMITLPEAARTASSQGIPLGSLRYVTSTMKIDFQGGPTPVSARAVQRYETASILRSSLMPTRPAR